MSLTKHLFPLSIFALTRCSSTCQPHSSALQIPFTSIQFPLYEFLKARASRSLGHRKLEAYEAAVCGSISGGVAAAVTTPLDVLKTRVMLDLRVSRPLYHVNDVPPSLHGRHRPDSNADDFSPSLCVGLLRHLGSAKAVTIASHAVHANIQERRAISAVLRGCSSDALDICGRGRLPGSLRVGDSSANAIRYHSF